MRHMIPEFWDNLFIFIFRKSRSPGKRSSRSPSRSPGRSTFGSDENDRVNNNNDAVGNNGESKTFPENWDSKAPSVGTLLPCLETTAYNIFFLGFFCFVFQEMFSICLK